MNTRERFLAVMNFRPFDRLPIIEWASWWDKTINRWKGEGLPAGHDASNKLELFRHFGQDEYQQFWIPFQKKGCPAPSHHGAPLIKDAADYDRFRKEFLYPLPCFPDPKVLEEAAQKQAKGDRVIWITLTGFFWGPRVLLGIEPHLTAFYDCPELMHRINQDLVEHDLKVLEEIGKYFKPDFMTFAEDLSYNNGPMLSKACFDEFLTPYYRQVVPVLEKMGTLPIVDSDGDVDLCAPWFIEAGIRGILPLERQAGCDVAALRKKHPGLLFIGHYDKMVMTKGEAAMRAEFERLLPVAVKGGFIPSVDHQTPPGVSYKEYLLFMRLFREYAEKAGKAA